jgi:hypothetical protein
MSAPVISRLRGRAVYRRRQVFLLTAPQAARFCGMRMPEFLKLKLPPTVNADPPQWSDDDLLAFMTEG